MTRFVLAALLALAASPALAEPLEFSADPGPALNIARTLMGTERGNPLHEDEIVSIALVDLDGDGTRDIFAFADASYFCGTAGCIPRLYRLERSTGHWAELPLETEATINGDATMWTIGDKDTSGWRTIIFTSPDVKLEFHWDGQVYTH